MSNLTTSNLITNDDHSICRMTNWNVICERELNKQINLELYASHYYEYLFSYFNRDNIGYKNIANYFHKSSLEEKEHANQLIIYQNKRGGVVKFNSIEQPEDFINDFYSKSDIQMGFEKALELENKVYKNLLHLHDVANEKCDPQFADYIEGNFLNEQIDSMNELSTYIGQISKIGFNGYGLFNFDLTFNI